MGVTLEQRMEALVVACAKSALGQSLGADALRVAVGAHKADIFSAAQVDLGPLWNLFEDQGLDRDGTTAAICRYKSWEDQLETRVLMPPALESLSLSDIERLAKEAPVSERALLRALGHAVEETGPFDLVAEPVAPQRRERIPPQLKLWSAVVVSAVSLSVAGFYGYRAFSGPSFDSVSASFAGDIPLTNARRLGAQVNATLADDAWLDEPRAERKAQLESALERLGTGIDGLIVLHRDKSVVGSAARTADGQVHITTR